MYYIIKRVDYILWLKCMICSWNCHIQLQYERYIQLPWNYFKHLQSIQTYNQSKNWLSVAHIFPKSMNDHNCWIEIDTWLYLIPMNDTKFKHIVLQNCVQSYRMSWVSLINESIFISLMSLLKLNVVWIANVECEWQIFVSIDICHEVFETIIECVCIRSSIHIGCVKDVNGKLLN